MPFITTLEQTFNGSLNVLITVGKALAIAAVAAAPWMPLAGVVGVVALLVWRRQKAAGAKAEAAAAKPA